jgi:aspartate kinase
MIVMKFGGTSNQDAAAMSNVIRIVKAHLDEQPIIVISAIARATNELEQTARVAASGAEDEAISIVTKLFERHNTIIDNLITSRARAAELEAVFYDHLTEIKALVKGLAILRELTPRTMDAMCSYGERLSSRIIAAGLQEADVDAVWVDAKDFMTTDENFGKAQPLTELVTSNLERMVRPLLAKWQTPVTQGFIGVTQSGAYTTMGRESSDYSASIIGAAMNAERVQIWTDVDGILTADPRMVSDTKKVNRMSFEEAFELSYFGAKVLHPNTMLPVLEKKIPVQILNSRREGSSGTVVDMTLDESSAPPIIKSIAFKKNLSIISITPHKRFSQYLFWEGIFNVLTRYGITTGMMGTSEYSIAFTVETNLAVEGLLHDLGEFGSVKVFERKGSLCLVGKGIRGTAGISNRIFQALAGVNVTMVSYGASDISMTLVIDENQIHDAINCLHREFFDSIKSSEIFSKVN